MVRDLLPGAEGGPGRGLPDDQQPAENQNRTAAVGVGISIRVGRAGNAGGDIGKINGEAEGGGRYPRLLPVPAWDDPHVDGREERGSSRVAPSVELTRPARDIMVIPGLAVKRALRRGLPSAHAASAIVLRPAEPLRAGAQCSTTVGSNCRPLFRRSSTPAPHLHRRGRVVGGHRIRECRRRRRSARPAGSPLRGGRPGSPVHPSARGASGRPAGPPLRASARRQQLGADQGMPLHHPALLRLQLRRASRGSLGDPDPADVVQQEAVFEARVVEQARLDWPRSARPRSAGREGRGGRSPRSSPRARRSAW